MIELASDLGGGKTTFVQGLAAGLGYAGEVTSPTFTLGRVYKIRPGLEVHHYDLYRLNEGGIVGDEVSEGLEDPEIVTVIEWADVARHDLPADRLIIRFELAGDEARKLKFSAGGPKSRHLLSALKEARA